MEDHVGETCANKPDLLPLFAGTRVSRVKFATFDFGLKNAIAVEIDGPPKLRHAVRYEGSLLKEAIYILREWAIANG